MKKLDISLPLTNKISKDLKAGDFVLLNGTIFTARDAAHKRLINDFDKNKSLPIDLKNQIIYYVGPTPGRPGQIIGAAGPTSSYRMDNFVEPLLKLGMKGMIGKGARSENVNKLCKKYKSIYFVTFGGCGALLSTCIVKSQPIVYKELGCEAIYELEVENFPAIVGIDCNGTSVF